MSDISGPPLPKPVDPVARTTGKTSAVSKDPQQAQTEAREHKGESSSKHEQAEHLRSREPAVSISATAAHLEVGERLKEQVKKIDNEGRPIIVTETATFALRPDAGLRPGDDVKLEIIEAGHKLAADLHERNGHTIDPPIRLALVVIAIHAKKQPQTNEIQQNPAPLPEKTGYGPAVLTKNVPSSTSDALASMLGRTSQASTPTQPAQYYATSAPAPEAQQALHAQVTGAPSEQTGNPDFLTSRNSSPDLATLIAAQQGDRSRSSGYVSTTNQNPASQKALDAAHLIPKSTLTELTTSGPQDGLGPEIRAFSFSGQAHSLQLMDPGTSQVSPAQVATVLAVRPLPPEDAKALPLPVNVLSPSGATLATLETNKGNFVIPLAQANNLAGELVKISDIQPPTDVPPKENPATFNAILATPGIGQRSGVTIQINQNAAPQGIPGEAQIKAVHTVRAFLTPKGPSADFRIETTQGELFVTMPNSFRPTTDDLIQILPAQTSQTQTAGLPLGAEQAAQLSAGTALSTLAAHHWPALEQSFATIMGSDPATASQLASKSAQGGGKLANSLLFFLSAAGRGNPEGWLGQDAARVLEQSNKSLFEAFKSGMSRLMQAATDTTSDWRPALLPLEMRMPDMPWVAMLFGPPPRDDGSGGSKQGSGSEGDDMQGAQRFLVEVRFSVLGAIQLDGLVRENRFDLAMRSEKPLPQTLMREASGLFAAALDANGYTGQLSITESQPFPMDVEALMQQAQIRPEHASLT